MSDAVLLKGRKNKSNGIKAVADWGLLATVGSFI